MSGHPIQELLLEGDVSLLRLRGTMGEHDEDNNSSSSSSRRRGLYASRACQAGELLHAEDAYVFSPLIADGIHASRSHFNLKESAGLRRCSGCRFALYATEGEQRMAWDAGHKEECASIRRCIDHGYSPSSTLLLATRVLSEKKREEKRGISKQNCRSLSLT
jgi:hypothetical protein